MDGYAPALVDHNLPLLVVSGLGSSSSETIVTDGGVRIASDIPGVVSEDAITLIKHFKDSNASDIAWNAREYGLKPRFRIKLVGRDYALPLRSASLPPSAQFSSATAKPVVHSALSPLSPGSALFPDGLLNSYWIEKHQEHVPSAFMLFYTFTSSPKLSTLHDNQLKSDISSVRAIISQSGYKIRLIVALLSEESIVQSPDVEERLANIRKATGLDSKTSLFFLPPQSSAIEILAFVDNVLSTIYPVCIEYYRDLSKHSRRKRNRGVVPPPTAPPTSGTLQTLSSHGWNVRYDFKLGVFAEFRQEMDSALRSYESGYEGLLGADVLEAISSWSLRWNEARLLADVFAIRIVRCLFWNGNYTAGARRWYSHRERMKDFVDRRGKGSATYSWEAWEARWATLMAELIKKISIPAFDSSEVYLPAEKSISMGERMQPWEYLHHPGYWFHMAYKHLIERRKLALRLPEEDRVNPSSLSDSGKAASKASNHDSYLCPEPHIENPLPGHKGIDHSILIIESLNKAMIEYMQRNQPRLVQELQLLSAQEGLNREAWGDALQILRPLWQNTMCRREGWWTAMEEIGWALRKAAFNAGDAGTVLAVDWELVNNNFTQQPGWHYDLRKSLHGATNTNCKPTVVLHDTDVHSFLTATYTFELPEGNVAELCSSQLVVTSNAMISAPPITMSEIHINFEGCMKPIILRHEKMIEPSKDVSKMSILRTVVLNEVTSDGRSVLEGTTALVFSPAQVVAFELRAALREAGETRATSVRFVMSDESFVIEYTQIIRETSSAAVWWGKTSIKRKITRPNASSLMILPKPPRVELQLQAQRKQYYTEEPIALQLEIENGEEEDAIVSLELGLTAEGIEALPITLITGSTNASNDAKPIASSHDNKYAGGLVGSMTASTRKTVQILIPALKFPLDYTLSIRAAYYLASDKETMIYQPFTRRLEIIDPFEANYDFSPRLHLDPWITLFEHEDGDSSEANEEQLVAHGLAQRWCLVARYASFATEDLIIEDIDIDILALNGGIQCHTKRLTDVPIGGLRVAPKSLEEAQFDTITQKLSLDDRSTSTLDILLAIKWRRDFSGSPINRTVLAVPRLLVSNSEPRVLATVSYSTKIPALVHFDLTIENPSNHFLTFAVTMDPSERFAFSGMKQSSLQLVPLSRKTIRYRILPAVRGEWIGPVHCVVKDRYYQKVLRVTATEGMRSDKEGIMLWIPLDDDLDG